MILKGSLFVGVWVLCLSFQVWAQEGDVMVSGKVIQIAGETIYVDVGREKGWQDGQVLQVLRNGANIGEIRVVRMADRFCACEALSETRGVGVGDDVRGIVVNKKAEEMTPLKLEVKHHSDTLAVRDKSVQTPVLASDNISEYHTIVSGKVALRYSFSDDRSQANQDVHQPAFVMDWNASQIGGTGVSFDFRVRARRQTSRRSTRPWFRLYDLALHYETPNNGLEFGVGRLSPIIVSGVGDFDGGMLRVRAGQKINVGFFGGFQPDLQTSGFDRNAHKMGAFVNWEQIGFRVFRQNTTLAFVGEYRNGRTEREYFYFQNYIGFGRKVSLFQHVAVDIDRSNQFAQMNKAQLHNAYTTLRISPSSSLSMSLGYDARNQTYLPFFESAEDSLIEVAFRQGVQANVSFRPLRHVFLYARGNVRMQKGEENSHAWSVGGTVTDFFNSGLRFRGRYTQVQGAFGHSQDVSLGASRGLKRWIYLDGEWGAYQSVMPSSTETRHRVTARLQIYFPKRTFLNVEHTVYSGNFKRALTFLELSKRF